MSFHPLVIGSETFNGSGVGRYVQNDVQFGGNTDEIRISPGSLVKNGAVVATVQRIQEFTVTINGESVRRRLQVKIDISAEPGVTVTQIDENLASLSTFATVDTLNRVMTGES